MIQPEDPTDHALTIRLLGPGEFYLNGQVRFSYAKVLALMLVLLLEPHPQSRERLTFLLWPTQGANQARNNLRNALHLLRKLVGPHRVRGDLHFVRWQTQPGDCVDIDLLSQPPQPPQLAILDKYTGEILSDLFVSDAPSFMDWLDTKRMHYQGLVMACTEKWYAQASLEGDQETRLAVTKLQARMDPCDENHQQRLIAALVEAGDLHGAQAQWDQACSILQRELEAPPSPAMIAQSGRLRPGKTIRQQHAGLMPTESDPLIPSSHTKDKTLRPAALLHIACHAKDPHDALSLQSLDTVRSGIEVSTSDHGGHLSWYNGASCLIRFDATDSQKSQCERALLTAIDITQKMSDHRMPWRTGAGLVRDLLLPSDGNVLDPLGHCAQIASMLAGDALGGKILATRQFALRMPEQPWVTSSRRWEHSVHEPLSIMRWAGEADKPMHEGPLLGRTTQQRVMLQKWEQTQQGQAKAILLSGSPGSGKSRLTRWAIQHMKPPVAVWRVDCQPARHDSPGAPLADWLGRVCDIKAHHRFEEKEQRLSSWLEQIPTPLSNSNADSLRRLMGLLPDDSSFTPTRRRRNLLDAFVELLACQTQQSPLLLVVEDMHWADATTLSVLDAALTQLTNHPLMILGTTRPCDHVSSNWSKLDIPPLNLRQSLELIKHILSSSGELMDAPPAPTLRTLAERSGGIPLFIESLAYSVAHLHGEFPLAIEEGLLVPLASDPDATELARAASVLGEEFELAFTRLLCPGLPHASFDAALLRLMRHGLMHKQSDHGKFRHALIRDAVYSSLPVAHKKPLHRQVIEISLHRTPDLPDQQPLWLARHAEHAGQIMQAIAWFEMAAMQALSVASFAEAIEHFNKALSLLEKELPLLAAAHQALRMALGRANATVPLYGYGAQATRDAFMAVLNLGLAEPDSNEVFLAHYGLWLGASSQGGYRQALDYVERLQNHADRSGDPVHRMQTAYAWGNTYMWLGKLDKAGDHLARALAACSGHDAQGLLASYSEDTGVIAASLLAWVRWLQGHDEAALELRDQSLARAQALSHPYSMAFALACAARLDILRGDAASLEQHVNQLDSLANKHDLGLWLALAAVQKGWLLCAQGHTDGALLAAKGVELAAPALPALEVTMLSMQADALHRLGDGSGCLRVVKQALGRCEYWDDRYMQPELLRLAACHAPHATQAQIWLGMAKDMAMHQGAERWIQKLSD